MGFNPALGADYTSRAMSSAYDSTQDANFKLAGQQNQLLGQQKTESEQKQREMLEMLRNSNPDLAAQYQYNMLNGITGADYTGYMKADGSFKTTSDEEKAFNARVKAMAFETGISEEEAESILRTNAKADLDKQIGDARNANIATQARDIANQIGDGTFDKEAFAALPKTDIIAIQKYIADSGNLTSYDGPKGVYKAKVPVGAVIMYGGRLAIVTENKRYSSDNKAVTVEFLDDGTQSRGTFKYENKA